MNPDPKRWIKCPACNAPAWEPTRFRGRLGWWWDEDPSAPDLLCPGCGIALQRCFTDDYSDDAVAYLQEGP